MKLPKLGKEGKRKFRCEQDPSTGEVHCESFREFEDQTTETLASQNFQFDSECKPIPTHLEGEEGELKKLNKWVLPLLKAKCKGKNPPDY